MVPSMHRTHCKHCSLIPPSTFNNNLALLKCGYMCAGMLVHISRHLDRTSNNNKIRCQLYIYCMLYRVCFHRASDFQFYDHYDIIAAYILLYHIWSIPLVFCPYLIIPWVFPTWYHLLYIYLLRMLVLMTRFSMHVYDSDLSIHVCLYMYAIWR